MNLSHLSTKQVKAVREGTIDWTGWSLCGTSVTLRAGAPRCDSCQMPVTVNPKGLWAYR